MKCEVGDIVRLFGTNEKRKVVNIIETLASDIDPVVINAYELEGERGSFVDIYDGTVEKI